ncbi:hypothetical protein ALC60_10817, partial [Trachymyrmex zeteki]
EVAAGALARTRATFSQACASLTSSTKEVPKSHSSIGARSAGDLPSRFRAGFMKTRLAKDSLLMIR